MSDTDKSPEKRAADILLRGGKMLALACPICSSPLYQTKDGEVLCVVCNRPVKLVSKEEYEKELEKKKTLKKNIDNETETKESIQEKKEFIEKESSVKKSDKMTADSQLENTETVMFAYDTLSSKLEEIMIRVKNETDLNTLDRLLQVAGRLLDLMLLIEEEY